MSDSTILIVGPVSAADGGTTTGGIATHVSDLAAELARQGRDVAVYADNVPAGTVPIVRPWGRVHSRPPLSRVSAVTAFATAPAIAARVARDPRISELGSSRGIVLAHALGVAAAAKDCGAGVIHIHQPDWRALHVELAGLTQLPTVMTLHSLSRFADSEKPAMRELVLAAVRRADALVCVSDDVATGLTALDPALSPEVVVNGVDLKRFNRTKHAPTDPPTILFAGRVVPEKGVPELIAALPAVRASAAGARLVLAGPVEGMAPAELAAAVGLPGDAVEALGPCDEICVAGLLAAATAAALPSHLREGQPRAILEAFAAGVPVVATRVGSVPQLLGDGAAGELVEPGDTDGIAAALTRVLTDAAHASRLTQTAYDRVGTYDLTHTTAALIAIYDRIEGGTA